ncbi:F-box protein CPR1-like isoform X1 [Rhododendron vialii]|uniref:F-box protein CPR1-like isoform X1 n=1 Tax=Rhododendron vialii TaxID=182163 RepID=UPI00265EA3A6|nr:F-box protein CPR1-like isoform X1 [Rhododendron vialii]
MEEDSDYSRQPSLPDAILLDILSRLPVKSLHRFKSVSTQFRHWISADPHFLKLHALHSADTRHRRRRRVAVLVSRKPPASVALRSVDADTLSDPSVVELCNDFKYSYPSARIWNSCNGLVLISISDKTFFVWNPSTREKEHVRSIPTFSLRASTRYCLLGLGFDKITDAYKVIAAYQTDDTGDSCFMSCSSLDGTRVSSNKQRVRRIGDFPYRICKDMPGSNVGGDLFWMVVGKTGDPAIIGFDFGAEEFVEMTQLRWEPGVLKYGLGVLGGSLCVACHGEGSVEVLGLKKGGAVESWEKLFVVPYNAGDLQFKTLTPLCFTGDGEVMMEIDRKRLVVYNIEEKTCRLLSYLPHEDKEELREITRSGQGLRLNGSGFKVVVYVESLVSPSSSSKSIQNLLSTVQQKLRLG